MFRFANCPGRRYGRPHRRAADLCGIAAWFLAALALPVAAQTGAPSTSPAPSTPESNAPAQRGGGGLGVGINVDLGSLLEGVLKKPDAKPAAAPGQPAPAGKRAAAPNVIVATGQTLAGAAKGSAPPPNEFDEMQRSTIVFRGVSVDPAAKGPCVDESPFRQIADDVGRQLAGTGRFDALEVSGAAGRSTEDFVKAVQAKLESDDPQGVLQTARERLEDRGENYDFRYAETVITGDAMRQVWNSVYGYEVHVGAPVVREVDTPNGRRYVASVPVTVSFYRLRMLGKDGRLVSAADAVQSVPGGQIRFTLNGSGAADPCDAIKRALLYSSAAIADQVEAIPPFRAIGTVVEVLDGNRVITMRPGEHEGVRVGDQYDIYDQTTDGRKVLVGRAVVERVGTGLVAAGMGASKADVTENRTHLRVTALQPGYDPANLRGSSLGPRS